MRSERFLESHSRETVHPDFYDQSHKDEDWRPARAGYDDRRPDGLGTQSDTRPHGSRVPPPPLATRMPNRVIYNDLRESRMPGLQATERQGSVQRNFTVAGDRATTGRGTSRGTGNNRTKRQHRPEPATTTSDEIDRALDRLALLRTREAESEKANDSQRVADLRNYAIPDQEKIISELRKKLNDHRGDKFRHPEVDTESESSDRDDLPATNGVEVLEEID